MYFVVNQLQAHLAQLSQLLEKAGFDQALCRALVRLSDPPQTNKHLTCVLGERSRGRKECINRLVGTSILPTRGLDHTHPLFLVHASEWTVEDETGKREFNTFPLPASAHPHTIWGPATILERTTLCLTPALNDIDESFEENLIANLSHADAYLFCVNAQQLLSHRERKTIQKRLEPNLVADSAIVISGDIDSLSQDDLTYIRRRVTAFTGGDTPFFLLSTRDNSELRNFLIASALEYEKNRPAKWGSKILSFLKYIERLPTEIEPELTSSEPSGTNHHSALLEIVHKIDACYLLANELQEKGFVK